MFSDAVLRDSYTLSPSHIGQATRCSSASARSSGVLGPLGPAGADGEEPDDDEHQQHPRRPPLDGRPRRHDVALPQPLQLAAEEVGGDLAR